MLYIQRIHFVVQQKLTQDCKAIILSLEKNTLLPFASFLTPCQSSHLLVPHCIQLEKKTLRNVSTSLNPHLSSITHSQSSVNLLSSHFKHNSHNHRKKKKKKKKKKQYTTYSPSSIPCFPAPWCVALTPAPPSPLNSTHFQSPAMKRLCYNAFCPCHILYWQGYGHIWPQIITGFASFSQCVICNSQKHFSFSTFQFTHMFFPLCYLIGSLRAVPKQ